MDHLVFSNAAYIQSDKHSFNVLSSGDPKTNNYIKLLKYYLLITIYEYFLSNTKHNQSDTIFKDAATF